MNTLELIYNYLLLTQNTISNISSVLLKKKSINIELYIYNP